MRKTIVLVTCLFAFSPVFSQKGYKRVHNQMLDEAKLLLGNGSHMDAAKIYRRLLPIDTAYAEVPYELALCYLAMPEQRDRAVEPLEIATRLGHLEATFELAAARLRQERPDEAVVLYERYMRSYGRAVADEEVKRRIAMCRTARELIASPIDMRIRNMGPMINSRAHDYCPLVTGDGNTLFFTSRRDGSTGGRRDPSGQAFEDIYTARRIDEVWSNATNAGIPLNTGVHDATVGISADGQRMIIYRTSPDMVSGDLYECERQGTSWTVPVKMTDRINTASHEPSACLSPDGSEIYFTSDRPGGFGGRDLYRIRRMPNGQWSMPLNLGPRVNTPFDEDAPFMHSDGITLFFSSNGHRTMGGYDIFKTLLLDPDLNGWSEPENMGSPLNTVHDDIYFSLSEDGTTGYFSSERAGGMGAQDIYQVIFPNSQTYHLIVRGLVTDQAEEPLRAQVTVFDEKRETLVGVYRTNARTGRFLMVLPPGGRYVLKVEAEGFDARKGELDATAYTEGREVPLDITLVRDDPTARAALKE